MQQAQLQLNSLGFDVGQADGVLGPKTEAALREFQKSRAIRESDPLGPLTREALKKAASQHTTEVLRSTALNKLMSLEDQTSTVPASANPFHSR